MIPALSEHTSFITVSVGSEIRVREGPKIGTGDVQRLSERKPPVFTADSNEDKQLDEPLNREQVKATVARLQESLKHVDPRIELSLEKDINRVIFRVVDKESGDLIRQIPSEKVVELARLFSVHSGLFVEESI